MDRKTRKRLQKIIGYKFKKPFYLKKALTHPSYMNEGGQRLAYNNQRYEFLGDAVIDLVIADLFLKLFPKKQEGALSKMRAKIVNEDSLARLAKQFSIGEFIYLGRGEAASGGREKPSILADCYEALIAAIYVDGGYKKAYKIVKRHFEEYLGLLKDDQQSLSFDYKTKLQEVAQRIHRVSPQYHLISEEGPDHEKIFSTEVKISGDSYGIGNGRTKKDSEQDAARVALENINDK